MIPVTVRDARLPADEVLDTLQAVTDSYALHISTVLGYLSVNAQLGKSVAMEDGEAPY